jgi:hypothetical protein
MRPVFKNASISPRAGIDAAAPRPGNRNRTGRCGKPHCLIKRHIPGKAGSKRTIKAITRRNAVYCFYREWRHKYGISAAFTIDSTALSKGYDIFFGASAAQMHCGPCASPCCILTRKSRANALPEIAQNSVKIGCLGKG